MAPGRPSHGSGDPRRGKNNPNKILKSILQFFKGFQARQVPQSSAAIDFQSTLDLGAIVYQPGDEPPPRTLQYAYA